MEFRSHRHASPQRENDSLRTSGHKSQLLVQDCSAVAALLHWFDHANDPQDDTTLLLLLSTAMSEPAVCQSMVSIGAHDFLRQLGPHMSAAQQQTIHSMLAHDSLAEAIGHTACIAYSTLHRHLHYQHQHQHQHRRDQQQQQHPAAGSGGAREVIRGTPTPRLKQPQASPTIPELSSARRLQSKAARTHPNILVGRQWRGYCVEGQMKQYTLGVLNPTSIACISSLETGPMTSLGLLAVYL